MWTLIRISKYVSLKQRLSNLHNTISAKSIYSWFDYTSFYKTWKKFHSHFLIKQFEYIVNEIEIGGHHFEVVALKLLTSLWTHFDWDTFDISENVADDCRCRWWAMWKFRLCMKINVRSFIAVMIETLKILSKLYNRIEHVICSSKWVWNVWIYIRNQNQKVALRLKPNQQKN